MSTLSVDPCRGRPAVVVPTDAESSTFFLKRPYLWPFFLGMRLPAAGQTLRLFRPPLFTRPPSPTCQSSWAATTKVFEAAPPRPPPAARPSSPHDVPANPSSSLDPQNNTAHLLPLRDLHLEGIAFHLVFRSATKRPIDPAVFSCLAIGSTLGEWNKKSPPCFPRWRRTPTRRYYVCARHASPRRCSPANS